MHKINDFLRRWWPTSLVLGAILWLTLAPHPVGDTEIELFPGADKVIHAIMMGGLALTALFDYSRNGTWRKSRNITGTVAAVTILLCIIFSCLDEWAQGAMDMGRSSDPLDLVADILGIIIAGISGVFLIRRILPGSSGSRSALGSSHKICGKDTGHPGKDQDQHG